MAKVCHYCGKTPVTGNKISHSNIKTKIRHFPNLQKVRALVDGLVQRVYSCTRCLRAGKVTKRPVMKRPAAALAAEAS